MPSTRGSGPSMCRSIVFAKGAHTRTRHVLSSTKFAPSVGCHDFLFISFLVPWNKTYGTSPHSRICTINLIPQANRDLQIALLWNCRSEEGGILQEEEGKVGPALAPRFLSRHPNFPLPLPKAESLPRNEVSVLCSACEIQTIH